MKDDSKIYSLLALLLLVGGGVGAYFAFFGGSEPERTVVPDDTANRGTKKAEEPRVDSAEFAPERVRPDPVTSKKPDKPVELDKAAPLKRMLIVGRVTDENGAGVGDVQVHFQGQGALAMLRGSGYTDPSGNYALLAWERKAVRLGPGTGNGGWVHCRASDGRAASGEPKMFELGARAEMDDLKLAKQSALEGRVTDTSGAPAVGAQVILRSQGMLRMLEESGGTASFEHRPIVRVTLADDRGVYSLKGLPPGKYGLNVEGGYFGTGAGRIDLDLSDGNLHWQEVELTQKNYVRGVLTDQSGGPIEGAVVILRQTEVVKDKDGKIINTNPEALEAGGERGARPRIGKRGDSFRKDLTLWRCLTDSRGRFGFSSVFDTQYSLQASLGKRTAEIRDVHINKPDYALQLEVDTSFEGTVRDTLNAPITRFDVRLFGGSDHSFTPFDKVDDNAAFPFHENGRYRVINPPTGNLQLRVSAPGYAPAVITIGELGQNERRAAVDVTLKPLCELRLTLKADGKLLPREPVMLLYDQRSAYEASSDEMGYVRIPSVPAATYEVRVQRVDGTILAAQLIVPAKPSETLTLELAAK